ncbi:unnamed protein product [Closterium sp. NIES-65]|nr:unnamed protein product [Closterium sp. NIES-65]
MSGSRHLCISDEAAIERLVDEVLAGNPKQLEQFRAGKTKLQGFFTGQVGFFTGQVGFFSGQVGFFTGQVGFFSGQVGFFTGQVGFFTRQLGGLVSERAGGLSERAGGLHEQLGGNGAPSCEGIEVMKASGGRVNPALMNKILMKKLHASS